jgi:hypothetical protein
MHKASKSRKLQGKGGGSSHKIAVHGILERGGEIRARVIDDNQITPTTSLTTPKNMLTARST